jgi:hypothetical protein
MSLCPKILLAAAVLLGASSSIAQDPYHSPDPDLIARLSYDNSGAVWRGNVWRVCVAVSRAGDYRIVRSLENGQTQRLHGKMSKEEFRQLTKLLGAAEFREAAESRSLSGDHGGLIRQEAESFAAEIPLGDRWHEDGVLSKWLEHETWRLRWLNADGERPFPASVSKLVDWLQSFQPKDGKSFEDAEYPHVCPAAGLRLLQPSVAENSQP